MAKKPTKRTKSNASATKTKPDAKNDLSQLDETGRRERPDRRSSEVPVASERRKTARRRQIDPTTCERDYTDAEIEFMHALDAYKRRSGRMFPTCSEILEVLGSLGYQKVEATADGGCQHSCSGNHFEVQVTS